MNHHDAPADAYLGGTTGATTDPAARLPGTGSDPWQTVLAVLAVTGLGLLVLAVSGRPHHD